MIEIEHESQQIFEAEQLNKRVEAEIYAVGGPAQVAEILDIKPTREVLSLEQEITTVVHHRLARVVAALPETHVQADRGVQAKLQRKIITEDAVEAEREKASLNLAQTVIRKHGIPPQYQDVVTEETQGWIWFVTSGTYDETVAEIKRDWKKIKNDHATEKPDDMSDDEFYTRLPNRLVAEKANETIHPSLTPITTDDMAYFMNRVRPYNRNTAVMQMISNAVKTDPTLLATPPGEIVKKLTPASDSPDTYTIFAPGILNRTPKEHELRNGTIDATGVDWEAVKTIMQGSDDISKVSFVEWDAVGNTDSPAIQIGMEYCPLYTPGGKLNESSLMANPQGKDAIISSRVGKKWGATHLALDAIQQFAATHQRQIIATVTFADWAVLAGNEAAANKEILEQHAQLYEKEAAKLLDTMGIMHRFQRLSDIAKESLVARGVEQFVVASQTETVSQIPDGLFELMNIVGLTQDDLDISTESKQRRARRILRDLLISCDGNIASSRGLATAYIVALPLFMEQNEFHLGMERSQNLLELPTIGQKRKPAMNILVS